MLRRFLATKTLPNVVKESQTLRGESLSKAILLREADYTLSKSKNGLVLCSCEDNSPISRIGVIVKAGSRYENYEKENLGVSHLLRITSSLATKKCSQFGLSQNLDHIGSALMVASTRDHFMYFMQCKRDEMPIAMQYLSYVITTPAFKHWEVRDNMYKLSDDLHLVAHEPETRLIEKIHRVSFRNGLNNSLFTPKSMIGKHTCGMLRDYHSEHFAANNMSIIGLGMNHGTLSEHVYKYFSQVKPGVDTIFERELDEKLQISDKTNDKAIKTFFPGEIRKYNTEPLVRALLVSEGGSFKNTKQMMCYALLQKIIGLGPHVKYGSLQASGKLAQACAASKLDPDRSPFTVSCYNANYSDTGLFGAFVVGQPNDMDKLLRCVVNLYRELGRSGVTDQELNNAKTLLKSSYLMSMENTLSNLEEVMLQTFLTHQVAKPDKIMGIIDGISADDVSKVAKKVIGTQKCSLAVSGNLKNTPYLDQLLA